MTGLRATVLVLGACSFTPGQLAGGPPNEAGVIDAPGDGTATADAQVDAMTGCGSCNDNDPCTVDTCNGSTCTSTPYALPTGCGAGALFSCAGQTTCYARCPTVTSWNTGEAACLLWSGHLASVASDPEAACVGTAVSGARVWIGLVQLAGMGFEPSTGWLFSDATVTLYTNWITGQPNNNTDVTAEGQDCAFSEGTGGEWYDHECAATDYAFVCER